MRGSVSLPFVVLFADTLATHGAGFAHRHYCRKHGMSNTEFWLWVRCAREVQS